MNKTKDPVGEKLKKVRKERGLSVPELSIIIDIPADRIYKWEAGKASPKYEDRLFIEKWIDMEDWKNVPRETSVKEPEAGYGTVDTLARALMNITEGEKNLKESLLTLTRNNERLVHLLEVKFLNQAMDLPAPGSAHTETLTNQNKKEPPVKG